MKQALAVAVLATLVLYAGYGICGHAALSETRAPAVAGQFYPADPQKLKLAIQEFVKDAVEVHTEKPIAVIVPHAGYIYSGQICADAFRQVMGHPYDVVVIIGVNHTTANFKGISLGNYGHFRTPLGSSAVDEEVVSALLAECKDCNRNSEVQAREHSIEVELPFIQTILPKARIVPAIIHPPDGKMCQRFGEALAKILKGRRALIVMSSDLSHYPTHRDAEKTDSLTLKTIAALDPARVSSVMRALDAPSLETRACGEAAILAGITAAKALGATRAVVVSYANSGDTLAGDTSRTVGYGAVILAPGSAPSDTTALNRAAPPSRAIPLQKSEKKALLAFARRAIQQYLTTQTVPLARNFPERMDYPQGAFVTLRKEGQLRGCIGHIPGETALGITVGSMALQAAFGDPRFAPVDIKEMKNIEIEISALTPMQTIASPDAIVVGRDGVLMSTAGTSAVFLPQVATENRWDRAEMLDNLCMKAGLQKGCWKRSAKFQVFQAEVFSESQFK
jgi:AmmeMemoRadiSam system protein B/AmmeMemoRadiSam system protein A